MGKQLRVFKAFKKDENAGVVLLQRAKIRVNYRYSSTCNANNRPADKAIQSMPKKKKKVS